MSNQTLTWLVCWAAVASTVALAVQIINSFDSFHFFRKTITVPVWWKTEKDFESKKELSITDMLKENDMDENEWAFETVGFQSPYDAKPSFAVFRNIKTNESRVVGMWKEENNG